MSLLLLLKVFINTYQSTLCICSEVTLRGYCTPDQKLACFVLYLKIINIFLKNSISSKLAKELKNGIEILVG